jgi:NAD(P)-dependent dehydrogenase (short-subunit alcohol dehydrogenase family)
MGFLEGRKAVITASGGKMGGATARLFAREGADVVLNDIVPERTEASARAIRELGREALSVTADVAQRAGAQAVVGAALERWGRVDILVNVAGGIVGPLMRPLLEMREEEWRGTLSLNLDSAFHCTQLALPGMIERRWGKIVNIASGAWAGRPEHIHYNVAKAGVVAFTRSLAELVGPDNINVNAIAPGLTENMLMEEGRLELAPGAGANPLGRINQPEDIANAVLFLVSEEARNISGQLLTVAGGRNPSLWR